MRLDDKGFRAWFGNSRVVDEGGAPLVVYHGTSNAFDGFLHGMYTTRSGFYFTDDPSFASEFAEMAADGIAYDPEERAGGPSVIPVYQNAPSAPSK